jgi:HEAT repeat protein
MKKQMVLAVLGAALLTTGCGAARSAGDASAGVSYTLAELVGRMPVKDTLEARWVWPAVLARGQNELRALFTEPPATWKASDEQVMYAIGGLSLFVSTGKASGADRAAFTEAIATALDATLSRERKAFLISQLQVAGGRESLAILSRFLGDPSLCEPAAQAMTAIGSGSEPYFLSALPSSSGRNRLTILHALGRVGTRQAVDALLEEIRGEDPSPKGLAFDALANIGDPRAEVPLMKEVMIARESERDAAAWRALRFGQRLAETGETSAALRLSHSLYETYDALGVSHLRVAALRTLVGLDGEGSMDDLVSSFADTAAANQRAVLDIARGMKGRQVTERWVKEMRAASPVSSMRIIDMLGDRQDASAFPAVVAQLENPDAGVRRSAILASVKLDGSASVPALLGLLSRSDERSDADAARLALGTLPPDRTVEPVVNALPGLKPPGAMAMLDLCASYKGGVPTDPLLRMTQSNSAQVRSAALKALGVLGTTKELPAVVDLYVNGASDGETAAALRCLVSLTEKNPDRRQRASAILEMMEKAPAARHPALLRALGRIGGQDALRVVCSQRKSKDPDVKEAAIRALADWPALEAFDSLLVLAGSKESLASRVLAIRALVRIVENAGVSPSTAVRYHERTLAAAFRIEEKRLVIGALASLQTPDALRPLVPYISDDSLGLDAGIAAWKIARGKGDRTVEESTRRLIEPRIPPHFKAQAARVFDARNDLNYPPEGFTALFNGRDLTGWKGLVENPIARAAMDPARLDSAQARADSSMRAHWSVRDGVLVFDGKGESLCSVKDYANVEMLVDWKIEKEGDSGIYLRGSPQVQIWDPAQWPEGSGGLYNNQKGPSHPLLRADNPIGEWNTFRIRMVGEYVTVYLNDVLVVDSVALENYWDRSQAIFPSGQIELQSHNSPLYFRNIFIRELPSTRPLFTGSLFNGNDLTGWEVVGGTNGSWGVNDGVLFTTGEGGGWLSTVKQYSNFELDLDFKVVEGGNSGVFLRSPHGGDPAYAGMEIQVLDDYAAVYARLMPWQYTGSIYGLQAPAIRATKKANEWQHMHIAADGTRVQVVLNGQKTVDADLLDFMNRETDHPGVKRRTGFIGLQNHTSRVEFRNIVLKELE